MDEPTSPEAPALLVVRARCATPEGALAELRALAAGFLRPA
jgi:hypothetical protein